MLFGQSANLTGYVLDSATREPVIGATVQVIELNKATVTNGEGFFKFLDLPFGGYSLEISFVGKQTLSQKVEVDNKGKALRLFLEDSPYTIEGVTVVSTEEASVKMGRLRAIEGVAIYAGKKSEVVLFDEMTANLATNNPRQVYGKVAGLNIWESDGAGLQLGIGGRGLSPNRTSNFNTRQNGYDISADALGYPESYYTPPSEALRRIEVVRGAASLQYGTQFGGMLNFDFKKPPADKKISLVSRQTLGSYGFFNSFNSLAGTVANGHLSYYTFYQYKQGDGWRGNSKFDLQNGFAGLTFKANEKLSLHGEWTHLQYLAQQPGGLTDTYFEDNARQSFRARNWFQVNWDLFSVSLDYKFSPRTRLNIRNFGLIAGREALGNLAPINVIDLGGNRDLIAGEFRNLGSETRLLHRYRWLGQEHSVVSGIRLYRGKTTSRQGEANDGSGPDFYFLNPGNVEKSDYTFRNENFAAFAENIFYINPKLTLTPGIRYEYINTGASGYYQQRVFDGAGNLISETRNNEDSQRSRQFVLVGLGVGYEASATIELYGNFSQNYRAINFSDLRIDNPNGQVDENIRDEQGFTSDLGMRLKRQWFYADITAFYIAYKDRIGWVLKANEPPLYNDFRFRTNIADARNIGLEGFAEANLWHFISPLDSLTKLSLFVNTSLIDARYINTDDRSILDKQVELVPPFTFRTGLNYSYRHFSAVLSWAYTGKHYTDATNAIRTSTAVNGIIPAYQVADFSATYRWKWLTLDVSCNNLFDAAYFTRRAESYPGPGIIPADGRSFYVTLGVGF
ncbi:MAG: TonB-dependent receptor [Saprospiraceae bacterium]|nr:MAG: TonB-dependent receptor [Saprospiraceae bacterium]